VQGTKQDYTTTKKAFKISGSRSTTRVQSPVDPGPWLYAGLILVIVFWVATAFFIRPNAKASEAEPLSGFLSLLTALMALFAGALVYKKIYDYTNQQSEKRKLKHDYMLRHLEEIYMPLWVETDDILRGIENYWEGSSIDGIHSAIYSRFQPGFTSTQFAQSRPPSLKEILNGPYRLFVDAKALILATAFSESIDAYKRTHEESDADLSHIVTSAVLALTPSRNLFGSEESIRSVFLSGPQGGCYAHVYVALANPQARQTLEIKFTGAINVAPGANVPNPKADFDGIMTSLLNSLKVKSFLDAREDCLRKGKALIDRMQEIIKDYNKIVLD
jgi:hypothetical protein